MENEIVIRKASLADLPVLLRFEQAIIAAERPFDETIREGDVHYYDIETMLSDPQVEIVVAEVDNRIIATGYARIEDAKHFLKHRQQAYFGFMNVHPSYRGEGINNMIIERLAQFAKANHVTELRLDVYADNEPAVRAYEKAGFKKLLIGMRKGI